MSTIDAQRRYLERLKKRRADPFYQQQAEWLVRRQAPEFREMGQQYREYLEREGASESAKAQALIGQQQKWAEIVSGAVEPARLKEEQRRKALEERIEEGEYRIDLMEEQEKEQEEARKRNFWKNLLKGIGTVAGVGASLAIPGLGAGMGAAIGELTGSVAGEIGYGEKYFEPAGIIQGLSDVAMEVATETDLKSEEKRATFLSQLSSSSSFITEAKNWNPVQLLAFENDVTNLPYSDLVKKYGMYIQKDIAPIMEGISQTIPRGIY